MVRQLRQLSARIAAVVLYGLMPSRHTSQTCLTICSNSPDTSTAAAATNRRTLVNRRLDPHTRQSSTVGSTRILDISTEPALRRRDSAHQ
jgi:hypothetical protein